MTAPLDDIGRLKELLDYRTAIGALALLVFACATLFVLLMKAKDKQLALAMQVVELGDRMRAAVEAQTKVVEDLAAQLSRRRARRPPPTEAA